jgi:DNA-binding winged helix-turn-helix (wHTH) protein
MAQWCNGARGDCELDEEARELRRAGQRAQLQPKELELLLYLVRHRDRVVSKEELLGALWPDTVVTDNSLTRAMSRVRAAVGGRATEVNAWCLEEYAACSANAFNRSRSSHLLTGRPNRS